MYAPGPPLVHGIHLIFSSPSRTCSGVGIAAFAMPWIAARAVS